MVVCVLIFWSPMVTIPQVDREGGGKERERERQGEMGRDRHAKPDT